MLKGGIERIKKWWGVKGDGKEKKERHDSTLII